jgi:hypothetical protein
MDLPKRLAREILRKLDGHLDQVLRKKSTLNLAKMLCLNEDLNASKVAETG